MSPQDISSDFDPYEQWLGISRHERPIDFYRLLGLERFESDPQRIVAAAEQRMAYMRQFQTGPRGLYTQKLLNEFASAKLKLLNPATKAEYDQRLRHSAQAAEEFALSDDVALPEPALSESSDNILRATLHAPIAPQTAPVTPDEPRFSAVPVQIQAMPRRAALQPTTSRGRRMVSIVIIAALVLAALGFSIVLWYQNRQDEIIKNQETEEKLVGTTSNTTIAVPEGVIEQRASGQVQLDARTAEIHGSTATLVREGDTGVIADWTADSDYLSWQFYLRKGAVFRMKVTYAVDGEPVAGRFQLRCDEQSKSWDLRDSGGLESFVTDEILMQVQEPGSHRLELRVTEKPDDVVVSVQSVLLEPRRR